MAEIMTVLGPIAPEELGFTSMHEHVLYDGQCFRRRFGNLIPADAPVKVDEPVTLDNLGKLKHGFIMSDDAIVMKDVELIVGGAGGLQGRGWIGGGGHEHPGTARGSPGDPEGVRGGAACTS